MIFKIGLIALIGAFIGYFTNVIAVKLLFRPLKPTTFLKIQGLIPKRKEQIAANIGDVVETELIKIEELIDEFIVKLDKERFKKQLGDFIKEAVHKKLPMFIPMSLVAPMIDDVIRDHGEEFIDVIAQKVVHEAAETVSIRDIVEQRILGYDLLKIEGLILDLARKELRAIEYWGAVLGFVIGIVQGLIITVL